MRVIIVGAGPAGLALAHMLPLAGIDDFVVLERRADVIEPSGAGVGLWPHNVRVLDQLGNGVLEEARTLVPKMKRSLRLEGTGRLVLENDLFDQIEENHGHPFMLFERVRFLQLLYERLPQNATRVLTNKAVVSLVPSESGVTVGCADGSSYEGDIIIGADGVRSVIRSLMSPLKPPVGDSVEKHVMPKGFSSSFKCIFGCGPRMEALSAGEMIETQDGGLSWQLLTSEDLVVWFFYIRMDRTTKEWSRHTDDEMNDLAEKYLDHPVTEKGAVTFGDLWRTRKRAKLVDLEEGIAETWYSGRVVLVGDSAHKMASNLALGANNAMESAASLANQLHDLVQDNPTPDTAAIEAAFATYQSQRKGRATWCKTFSGTMIRYAGWLNGVLLFLCRFMTIDSGDRFVADMVFPWIPRDGIVLSFVPESNYKVGLMPWADTGTKPKTVD